ncbi:MAG: hypothetical protein NTY09_10190 [bacterium]|nr:hypothetical protein [bacterium]
MEFYLITESTIYPRHCRITRQLGLMEFATPFVLVELDAPMPWYLWTDIIKDTQHSTNHLVLSTYIDSYLLWPKIPSGKQIPVNAWEFKDGISHQGKLLRKNLKRSDRGFIVNTYKEAILYGSFSFDPDGLIKSMMDHIDYEVNKTKLYTTYKLSKAIPDPPIPFYQRLKALLINILSNQKCTLICLDNPIPENIKIEWPQEGNTRTISPDTQIDFLYDRVRKSNCIITGEIKIPDLREIKIDGIHGNPREVNEYLFESLKTPFVISSPSEHEDWYITY